MSKPQIANSTSMRLRKFSLRLNVSRKTKFRSSA